MNSSWETDSDSSLDEIISVCLLNQCLGCSLCQNSEFLTASRLIEELKKKIDDATVEIEHLRRLRQVRCNHHLILDRTAEVCARCGLHRSRLRAAAPLFVKCIRQGCEKEIEQGICQKHNRPKRACSLACYQEWKASREAGGPQQPAQTRNGRGERVQSHGGALQGDEAQGVAGSVQQSRSA